VQVQWDFDADGTFDETTKEPQVTYSFFRKGPVTVKAVVELLNRTQTPYERTIEIVDPPALPFPVSLTTEPKHLISPPPFSMLLTIETAEPIAQVQWDFGDGTKAEGLRVAHTYEKRGDFPVYARVRSMSGQVANLSTVVRVVEPLRLSDLTFDGSPSFNGDRIEGEVPLALNLTPKTTTPFVTFLWEAPDATEVGSVEGSLQAIYRREGTYNITLIGQDLEDHVVRKVIQIFVSAVSPLLTIAMDPETGTAPLLVKFDASESSIPDENPAGFEWDFGDQSQPYFGSARTEHLYSQPGTYLVRLTIRTTSGKDYDATKTVVVRLPNVACIILPSRTSGTIPLGIAFEVSCGAGTPTKYLWDFGDGAQTDQSKPTHVFETAGTYNVTLSLTDSTGRTSTQTVTITARP
jgi:PKD repeat protein